MKKNQKHKGMLPNGRSAKGAAKFENWFGRFYPKDVAYPAWRHLSKTATDVAFICKAKNGYAGAIGGKDGSRDHDRA